MLKQRKWIITGILLAISVGINRYSGNAERVENGFATSFYPKFSNFLRFLFGWIPFSIGDILYGALVVYLLVNLFRLLRYVFSKKRSAGFKEKAISVLPNLISVCCIIYIVFNVFWGINYNREGIAKQLGLKIEKYNMEDLKSINELLVKKINESKLVVVNKNKPYVSNAELFLKTEEAYKEAVKKYPFLLYKQVSIKSSLWGWIGNYTGFLGYYNPFTGEAQINTTVPKFTQPYTACHEVAHQLGYAKEMEANFVGYLSASSSTDTLFRYSMYADLFGYANRTLYIADSVAALQNRKLLIPQVIVDFRERRKFYESHTSFAEPIVRYIYGKFLESNQQPMGILSYDEVTAFIIAYYKKYGDI
jgi:Protein of unknown function (DUF3810)